ncbi:MAG TPA: hypothetical protein PK922_03770 [Syntrophorhabdus sp.]|nr:hypothetical protein [Syntrophorhabdus sp.]
MRYRTGSVRVLEFVLCPLCHAPHEYLYYNDGKKRIQLLCKIYNEIFRVERQFQKKIFYECCNDACVYQIRQTNKLNEREYQLV